ncbi:MAG: PLP-dependent transferase, partial [Oscillibacter sp.]|nr:PLP-dependent transferase [Oscillibacter sp.]
LPFSMKQHCANAQAIAEYLKGHEKVKWVKYCGLEGDRYYEMTPEDVAAMNELLQIGE